MIEYIQKRVGISIGIFALLSSTIVFLYYNILQGYSINIVLANPAVSFVFLAGIFILFTAVIKNNITRFIQVILFYAAGIIPSFEAIPGNLNGAIFIGFSLLLLIEYGFLEDHYVVKIVIFISIYIASIIYGFVFASNVPLLDILHSLLGITLALYIFYIMIEIRTSRQVKINQELEVMVDDRTKELKTKIEEVERYKGELERKIDEKNILLQELQHRTKNNLQLVKSLLDLELSGINNEKEFNIIVKTKNRIHAMSAVYEFIYKRDNLITLSLNDYIQTLFSDLWGVYYSENIFLNLKLGEDVVIGIERVTSLGLILNELLCNSVTHAFDENDKGNIDVSTQLNRDKISLIFKDNGKGFEQENIKQLFCNYSLLSAPTSFSPHRGRVSGLILHAQ